MDKETARILMDSSMDQARLSTGGVYMRGYYTGLVSAYAIASASVELYELFEQYRKELAALPGLRAEVAA